ncbi:MAG: glycosyltransferase [Muribaculaceae bacterium]|nr:glycosyltransferase [Muribaculaceae bacterium]
MIDLSLSFPELLLLLTSFISLLVSIGYGLNAYRRAAVFRDIPVARPEEYHPKASVLIYCQSEEEVLDATLEQISRQDYPDFEVIVVCDAASEYSEMLNEKYGSMYSNVYVTFVQPGSHNLSRRKLAITIGAKAAKGEVLVTTVANIWISSEQWLSQLLAPFCGERGRHIDVSLGYSRINFANLHGIGKWYRQFDALLTDALWIGYAADYKPYRGDGFNLAFRREVFFKHKGFAKTINLHYGDDDLFIHEISTPSNTSVVVSPESIIETQWDESGNRIWTIQKERYSFTSRWLPKAPFVRSSIQMLMQWLVPGSSIAAALIGLPNLLSVILGGLIILCFWLVEIIFYRRLAQRFEAIRLWWAVWPFWLWRPLADLLFRYDHRYTRKKNFTWQR